MNFKKSALASAITLATFATGAAAFDASSWEVSGFVKNETAALQKDGTFIGQRPTAIDTGDKNDSGDVIKFENTAKVFINGDLAENAALHAELNFVYDTEATPNDYQGHMSYSQNDYLRELYVDTMVGDTEVRVGKQQVVWGTADGIKLLDIINPTDYREFAQNTMEDSRIPVWMVKTDTPVGETGNFQFVVSQARSNKIPGMESCGSNGDSGNAFLMKGVDTICGGVNGFVDIVPALGAVSNTFNVTPGYTGGNLNGATGLTVAAYVGGGNGGSWTGLNQAAQATNNNVTKLTDATSSASSSVVSYSTSNPDSVFEYMSDATFGTFDTFVNATSSYVVDHPDDTDMNLGFRFKDYTDGGTNYSVNYLYAYDPNPYIELNWKNSSGEVLNTVLGTNNTIDLTDSSGNYYGAYGAAGSSTAVNRVANLEFREKLNRIHNLGGAFDTTVDNETLPVVVRGEFLYQKDVRTPVLDRNKLAYGDLVGAMQAKKGDYFKYVIGADVNVMTNMMVSGQFIQFRNLDYVDSRVDASGAACSASDANCGVYTGDMATMHLSNNLQKAKENKEFYSLFLSKPFGANQLGRWNNIFIFEEGGGKWNRFDVEYSFSDELVGSFELNNYWGDANTQFGQMEDSSNIQVGLKYLF
jgi:hypothetical protein